VATRMAARTSSLPPCPSASPLDGRRGPGGRAPRRGDPWAGRAGFARTRPSAPPRCRPRCGVAGRRRGVEHDDVHGSVIDRQTPTGCPLLENSSTLVVGDLVVPDGEGWERAATRVMLLLEPTRQEGPPSRALTTMSPVCARVGGVPLPRRGDQGVNRRCRSVCRRRPALWRGLRRPASARW